MPISKLFHFRRGLAYLGILLFLSPTLSLATEEAAFLYRYQNNEGEKITGYQVPAESIKYGYEILNKSLRVIRVIEPALSDEALALIEENKIGKREEEKLLQSFSSSKDAERSRDRKIAALDVIIKITEGNIHRLNVEYESVASQAAKIEKRGGAVPDTILTNMDNIISQISDANVFISGKKKEIDAIYAEYEGDIKKLQKIEAATEAAKDNK